MYVSFSNEISNIALNVNLVFPASEQPQNHTVALNLQKSFSAAIRGINDLKSPSNIQEAASLEANPEDGWIGTDTKSAAGKGNRG